MHSVLRFTADSGHFAAACAPSAKNVMATNRLIPTSTGCWGNCDWEFGKFRFQQNSMIPYFSSRYHDWIDTTAAKWIRIVTRQQSCQQTQHQTWLNWQPANRTDLVTPLPDVGPSKCRLNGWVHQIGHDISALNSNLVWTISYENRMKHL